MTGTSSKMPTDPKKGYAVAWGNPSTVPAGMVGSSGMVRVKPPRTGRNVGRGTLAIWGVVVLLVGLTLGAIWVEVAVMTGKPGDARGMDLLREAGLRGTASSTFLTLHGTSESYRGGIHVVEGSELEALKGGNNGTVEAVAENLIKRGSSKKVKEEEKVVAGEETGAEDKNGEEKAVEGEENIGVEEEIGGQEKLGKKKKKGSKTKTGDGKKGGAKTEPGAGSQEGVEGGVEQEASQGVRPDAGSASTGFNLKAMEECGPEQNQRHSPNFIPPTGSKPPPRFVAVGQIVEQFTKARTHVGEIMALAKALNRSFVLPTCGGSHVGIFPQSSLAACTHYDVDVIAEYIPWVTEAYLNEDYVKAYGRAPSVFVLDLIFNTMTCEYCIRVPNRPCQDVSTYPAFEARLKEGVLTRGMLDGSAPHMCITSDEKGHQVEKIRTWEADFDILLINKRSWGGFFDQEIDKEKAVARAHLQYTPKVFAKAAELAARQLGQRYLAVYWRLEKTVETGTSEERWRECADGLVASARRVMAANNISAIFMASDFIPLPNGTILMKSDTMQAQVSDGVKAKLTEILQGVHAALKPVTWDTAVPETATLDGGVLSLLDKAQCTMATIFLFAPPECYHPDPKGSFQTSTYLIDIMKLRKDKGQPEETKGPWLTVHKLDDARDPYIPSGHGSTQ